MRRPHNKQAYPDMLKSPLGRYYQLGDRRTSAQRLQGLFRAISSIEPHAQLTKADIAIDLAVRDPDATARHIRAAEECLQEAIESTDDMHRSGYESETRRRASTAIKARLRLAELGTWEQVAQGTPRPTPLYPNLLEASRDSLRFLPGNQPQYTSTLVEFMPVLLGSRGLSRAAAAGWQGRLSLQREDKRHYIVSRQNPNWDCGVVADDDATYDSPNLRLQMKNGHNPQSAHPEVTKVNANRYKLNQPVRIIQSCLAEFDGVQFPSLLSTGELDDISGTFYDEVLRPAA